MGVVLHLLGKEVVLWVDADVQCKEQVVVVGCVAGSDNEEVKEGKKRVQRKMENCGFGHREHVPW